MRCSYCETSKADANLLFAGPSVYICDECVGLCGDIIAERRGTRTAAAAAEKTDARPASDTLPITRAEAELFSEALDHLPDFAGDEQKAMLAKLRAFLRGVTP